MKHFCIYILLFAGMGASTLEALPAQVIIVRHGEKDPVTRGLTPQGQERAGALAFYLTETDYLLTYGPPAAIFASRSVPRSDRIVPRTIETIMPTAELLQLPIHSPFNGYQVNEIANLILNSSRYQGKNVVICWNHSSIHDLLVAFGYQAPFLCDIPPYLNNFYPDCRFDLVFVITFPAPPPPPGIPAPFIPNLPFATVYLQQLLFGDLTCADICAANPSPPPACDYPPSLPASPCFCTDPTSCAQICEIFCPDIGLGDD